MKPENPVKWRGKEEKKKKKKERIENLNIDQLYTQSSKIPTF